MEEASSPPASAAHAVHGYVRTEVEAYFAAVDELSESLIAQITAQETRRAAAENALAEAVAGYQLLGHLLIEAQRDVNRIWEDGHRRAAELIAAAEADATALLEQARSIAHEAVGPSEEPVTPSPEPADTAETSMEEYRRRRSERRRLRPPRLVEEWRSERPFDDDFFADLRAALADDAPLGPRVEMG